MQGLASRLAGSGPEFAAPLQRIAGEWGELTLALGGKAMANLDEVGAASVDYLFYSGYAALAYCWARIAETAAAGDPADPFLPANSRPRGSISSACCRARRATRRCWKRAPDR